VAKNVDGLQPGLYRYLPDGHQLRFLTKGDLANRLSGAALNQPSVNNAPAVIVISAVPERKTVKYGERGMQYVCMEAGHAA
jgi:SagB-type dehydrogenase family enzyme